MMSVRDRVLVAGAVATVLLQEKQNGMPFTERDIERAIAVSEWAAINCTEAFAEKEGTVPTLLDLGERAMQGEL